MQKLTAVPVESLLYNGCWFNKLTGTHSVIRLKVEWRLLMCSVFYWLHLKPSRSIRVRTTAVFGTNDLSMHNSHRGQWQDSWLVGKMTCCMLSVLGVTFWLMFRKYGRSEFVCMHKRGNETTKIPKFGYSYGMIRRALEVYCGLSLKSVMWLP